jgi:hypothetical protein
MNADAARARAFAKELIDLQPDVILTGSTCISQRKNNWTTEARFGSRTALRTTGACGSFTPDCVAKVVLRRGSKILRAVGATFV